MNNKIVFAAVLALLTFAQGFAQKSMVKLQIGYGIPLANTLLSNNVASNSNNNMVCMVRYVYGSYGSGLIYLNCYILEAYLIFKMMNALYTSPNGSQRSKTPISLPKI